jgi:hypothetical protein
VLTAVMASLLIMSFAAGDAAAQQDNGDQTQARTREQIKDNAQDPQGEMLRKQIRDRIQNEDGLKEQEREQLKKHLGECEQLGLDVETVAALFDETKPLQKQIRTQARVLTMTREGLPTEPVMQKLRGVRWSGLSRQKTAFFKVDHQLFLEAATERRA